MMEETGPEDAEAPKLDTQEEIPINENIKIIVTPNRSAWVRVTWLFAILICLVLFFIQIEERVAFYLDDSNAVATKIVETTKDLTTYPKITVCSSHMNYLYNDGSLPDSPRELLEAKPSQLCNYLNENTTLEKIYQKLKIPLNNIELTGQDSPIENWFQVPFGSSRFHSQLGPCITITPRVKSVKKLRLRITDHLNSLNQQFTVYKLYMHEEDHPPSPEWLLKHSTLYSDEPLSAVIDTNQFTNINTAKSQCIEKQLYEQCRHRCIDEMYYNKPPICRLPYDETDQQIPACTKKVECSRAVSNTWKAYLNMDVGKCNCPRKCDWFLHNVQFSKGLSNRFQTPQIATLELQFSSYTRIREHYAYNLASLLSDISGCLGLSLGVIILATLEITISVKSWIEYCKAKRSSKTTPGVRNENESKYTIRNLISRYFPTDELKIPLQQEYANSQVILEGFDIFYNHHPLLTKIVWIAALILCIVLSTLQLDQHFQRLLTNSTAVHISIAPNEELTKPFITVCPLVNISDWQFHARLTNVLDSFEKKFNHTLSDECDLLKIPGKDNIRLPISLVHPNTVSKLTSKMTMLRRGTYYFPKIYGSCYGVELGAVFANNKFIHDVNIGITNRGGWNFTATPGKFVIFLSDNLNFMDFEVMQQSHIIQANAINYLTVEPSKFVHLNLSSRPCRNKATTNHFRAVCYANHLHDKMPCQLGHMGIRLPLCNTTDTCKSAYRINKQVLSEFDWNICEPPPPPRCSQVIYKFSKYTTPHHFLPTVDNTEINIHFQDIVIKHVEEYTSYTFISLLSDVGAIIGVTVSACLLTLIQILQLIMYVITSLKEKKNPQ